MPAEVRHLDLGAPSWARGTDAAAEAPPSVRRHLKDLESTAYALEAKLPHAAAAAAAGGGDNGGGGDAARAHTIAGRAAAKAAAEGAAAAARGDDSRRHIFRIDDITHERPGGMAADGQHRQRISAVNAIDNEPFPEIEYLHACVGGEGVEIASDAAFLTGCGTIGGCCQPEECSCMHEQVVQSGKVLYDEKGRLQAADGTPIYECNAACGCAPTCRNRVVQRGIAQSIQVYKTRHKGWAVRALAPIPKGSFVCEYTGEIITTEEAERRGVEYDKSGFSTLFDLDAAVGQGGECEYTIDATYKCGVARFLNHSCAPNLRQMCVWVDNVSLALPRIAFFATRHIEALEELTFDYKYEEGGRTLQCHCGAPNCRKWLY